MSKNFTIDDMQDYAKDKGGKCLSKEYIDSSSPLKWRCEKGHTWDADFQIIRQGGWCKQCMKAESDKSERFEKIKAIAIAKGGKCLSTKYIKTKEKLDFECGEGHKWKTSGFSITTNKTWCPICAGSIPLTIEDMKNNAAKHGGLCLSEKYVNVNTKLKWQCSEGHIWMTNPMNIRAGKWCHICARKRVGDFHRDSIETFQEIAKKRGGKCLSTTYSNNLVKLEFECAEGHRWKAAPILIKNANNWCPKCGRISCGIKNREDIEIYHQIAKKHGGKCLNFEYKGNRVIIELECAEGHKWTVPGHSIKQGNWCFKCAHIRIAAKQFDTIETFQAIAKEQGGKVLSKEYESSLTKMKFECSEGHVFWASPSTVKNHHIWCIICNKNKRDIPKNIIERFQKLALEKGGKCLSEACSNTHEILEWECAEGHTWKVTGQGIVCGNWCKKCGYKIAALKNTDTIESIQEIAKKNGGKCLSETYEGRNVKLKFKCSEGHIWMATPGNIKNHSTWCVICNKKNKK